MSSYSLNLDAVMVEQVTMLLRNFFFLGALPKLYNLSNHGSL